MQWSFINSFISILSLRCLCNSWNYIQYVWLIKQANVPNLLLTKLRKVWRSSNNTHYQADSPSPNILPLKVFKPALHNQQAYAMSWTNVNKQNLCFKTQSVLPVMNVWWTVTMVSGEAPAHEWAADKSPPQNIMISSLILTSSWMQPCQGAIPDKHRFGKALLHLWDLHPWLWLLLERGFLPEGGSLEPHDPNCVGQ